MSDHTPQPTPKVHPASREVLPDDPMNLHAIELDGDADLMLRLLVEEYASMGWSLPAILDLARDPNYQAFHGLYLQLGEDAMRDRITAILSRVGVMRVTVSEAAMPPENLVQINLSASLSRRAADA